MTGSSSLVGGRISQRLAQAGMKVVGLSRRNVVDTSFSHVIADVTNESECVDAIKQIHATHGRLDLVVHCAGVTQNKLLVRSSHVDFDRMLSVNLHGAMNITRAALKHGGMLSAKDGCFLFIGSAVGSHGNAGQVAYGASKGALEAAMKCLSKEYGGSNVRFNVIAPGLIDAPGMRDTISREQQEMWKDRSCLKRLASPDDLADLVIGLSDCALLTGQTIVLDGGRV